MRSTAKRASTPTETGAAPRHRTRTLAYRGIVFSAAKAQSARRFEAQKERETLGEMECPVGPFVKF